MKLKLAVKITLIACGVLTILLIFTGFVFGKSTVDTLSSNRTLVGGDGSSTSGDQGGTDTQNTDEKETAEGTNPT